MKPSTADHFPGKGFPMASGRGSRGRHFEICTAQVLLAEGKMASADKLVANSKCESLHFILVVVDLFVWSFDFLDFVCLVLGWSFAWLQLWLQL